MRVVSVIPEIGVTEIIAIELALVWVGSPSAVVADVAYIIPIVVQLTDVYNAGAVVAGIANTICVRIFAIGVVVDEIIAIVVDAIAELYRSRANGWVGIVAVALTL